MEANVFFELDCLVATLTAIVLLLLLLLNYLLVVTE